MSICCHPQHSISSSTKEFSQVVSAEHRGVAEPEELLQCTCWDLVPRRCFSCTCRSGMCWRLRRGRAQEVATCNIQFSEFDCLGLFLFVLI